jgi:outer membrane protein TolC
MRAATVMALVVLAAGCTRAHYRRSADRDSYRAIEERNNCPEWQLPRIDIDPAPESRLADPYNPDRPPMPPDDPAADRYMVRANGMRGSKHWHDDGDAPSVEPPGWRNALPLDSDGVLVLTPDRAVGLALLESREYQSALEDVYLSALSLTLNRFEFACHWFATNDSTFEWFGSGPTETDTFTSTSTLGFTKNFAAGGQLLAEFANAIVVNFTAGHTTVQSDLVGQFVQPLLRGAGRKVRMEGLTQAERSLLYSVRSFARFRKTFWADLTTRNNGFLQLLLQVQNIRNLETNVTTQEQILRLHEALFAGGITSTVYVDQVYQSYQQARFALLQAQTSLDNSLDTYKIQLGLPPDVPVKLDDSQLAPFQLAEPGLTRDQDAAEQLLARYRARAQQPAPDEMRAGFDELRDLAAKGRRYGAQVETELKRWRVKLGDPAAALDPASHDREEALSRTIGQQLGTTRDGLADLAGQIDKASGLAPVEAWRQLQILARRLIARLGEVYVAQTQVRVFLIDLPAVNTPPEAEAICIALRDRLDVMNERATVVDSWRKVAVAANGLEAGLNLVLNADIGTPPGGNRPFDFSAANSRYSAGLQFDGPLNRYAERNIYRTSLIDYERSRRDLMALEDNVRQAIRRDLRQLKTDKLGFAIARLTLIAAARQLDGAREELLIAPRGAESATGTLTILNALSSVLAARNALIGSYISYETDRVQLLLDLEALQLDERGIPPDDRATPAPLLDPAELLPAPRGLDRR